MYIFTLETNFIGHVPVLSYHYVNNLIIKCNVILKRNIYEL